MYLALFLCPFIHFTLCELWRKNYFAQIVAFYVTMKNALSIFTAKSGQKFNVGPLSKVFNA